MELASYKIPEQFILRSNEQLPRTSTGKINKPALKSQIIKALEKDLGKPPTEAFFEIIALKQELN